MKIDIKLNDEQLIAEELAAIQSETDLAIIARKYAKYDNALQEAIDNEEKDLTTLLRLKKIVSNRLIFLIMEQNGWRMNESYWIEPGRKKE